MNTVDELTHRENEVLAQVIVGKRNRETAQEHVISESTVENHVHRILEKLNVSTRMEAAFPVTKIILSKKRRILKQDETSACSHCKK